MGLRREDKSYHHLVLPRPQAQFMKAGNKIPTSGDVASDKDAQSKDGERVHVFRLVFIAW